MLIKNWSEV